MVVKKRISKRINTRKREKIVKKVREHNRKMRRVKKNGKNRTIAPPSVFQTEEHRLILKRIKEGVEYRQKICEEKKKAEGYALFPKGLEDYDIVLKFVDARDPLGSGSDDFSSFPRLEDKHCYKIYYNTTFIPREALEKWLEHDKALLDIDFSTINQLFKEIDKEEVCVLIAADNGFDESYFSSRKFDKKVKFGRVFTQCRNGLGSVLRDAISLNHGNYRECIEALMNSFEKTYLLLKYKIPNFSSIDEFLSLVGSLKQFFTRNGKKVDLIKAGSWVLDSIKESFFFFTDSSGKLSFLSPDLLQTVSNQDI